MFKIALLTFTALHGKGPSYLRDMLTPAVPTRVPRSATNEQPGGSGHTAKQIRWKGVLSGIP